VNLTPCFSLKIASFYSWFIVTFIRKIKSNLYKYYFNSFYGTNVKITLYQLN